MTPRLSTRRRDAVAAALNVNRSHDDVTDVLQAIEDAERTEDMADVRRAIKSAVADREDATENGAPVGDVIEAVAADYRLSDVIDELSHLHRTGEVYQPSSTTLKRTNA